MSQRSKPPADAARPGEGWRASGLGGFLSALMGEEDEGVFAVYALFVVVGGFVCGVCGGVEVVLPG